MYTFTRLSVDTGLDPWKSKSYKPSFNVGQTSARQQNAIYDPLLVLFGSSLPSSKKDKKKKKTLSEMDPLWQNFLDPRMGLVFF